MLPWGSRGPPGGLGGLTGPSFPLPTGGWRSTEDKGWGPSAPPPRLIPQRSYLRLSQSLRWTQGGVVVESHAASAQVMCTVASEETAAVRIILLFSP